MNATNVTVAFFELSPVHQAAVVLFSLLSISGVLAYCLVLFILLAYFKEFKSNFYCVIISLAIPDLAFLFDVLFYVVPCVVLKRKLGSSVDVLAGLLQSIAFFCQCSHLTFIAANRLAYACATTIAPKQLEKIFNSKKAITFWLVVLWAFAFGPSCAVQIVGCDKHFDYESMFFSPLCHDGTDKKTTEAAIFADIIISTGVPALITILHLAAWLAIRLRRKSNSVNDQDFGQQRKRERRILFQFSLISLAMLLYIVSFWIIPPFLPDSKGGLVVILLGLISSAVNPFTYLAFNKLMKKKAKNMIRVLFNKANDQIVPVVSDPLFVSSGIKYTGQNSEKQ